MPKASPIQTSFAGGKFDERLLGRVDAARYREGLLDSQNFILTLQGPAYKRSGFKHIAEVKTSSKATRLIPFEFSVTQAYIIEVGDLYMRFYRNNGQIISGVPVEIVTPYTEAQIFDLRFTQSADVLYIVHPSHEPRTLSRTSHTAWTLAELDFLDGPYLNTNATATTITPSATTGAGITLTASAVTGINGDTGFQATDVGRLVRILHGSTWGYAEIVGHTSTTVVTADVKSDFGAASASASWRLGVWSDTTGFPAVTTFHEGRLAFAGATDNPQRVDMSVIDDFVNFAPSATDGTITDSNALSFTFNATEVNVIRWMVSDEKGLIVGTAGAEWVVRPSSAAEALTPTNITAKRSTTFGSANIQALQVGKSALFVQRAGRKVREVTFFFDVDGFRSLDLTLLSESISTGGIKEMTHAKEPQPILWVARNDGKLLSLTYERDVDNFKAAWSEHVVGGVSDAAGTAAKVESVASIPSEDGSHDQLWVVVQRHINGATERYVEVLSPEFNDEVDQQDAFFVDSGLTLDSPITMTGATQTDPVVITAAGHSLVAGDKVLFNEVKGMTQLNGNTYLVANETASTFEITSLSGVDVDGTGFSAYVSGGEVRKMVTTISGLSHLEGETVDVLADGAVLPPQAVSSGSITITEPAAVIHVGLNYVGDLRTLRLDAGAADGTAIGKTRRIHRTGLMVHRTLGVKLGPTFSDLTEIVFRKAGDKMDRAVPLFTGILEETLEQDYDFDNNIAIRSSQPLPCNLLAIMPQLHTQDR